MFIVKKMSLIAALIATVLHASDDAAWDTVQDILMSTQDIVVLDGTEKAPLRYDENGEAAYGDWMVRHMLSDPQAMNPYTSSDAGASTVLQHIFDTLLYSDHEPPYELRGKVAKGYPQVSEDKLSYTFDLRENVFFSDGRSMTVEDVLFSMKVIKNPRVLAPHLRNYYSAVIDVFAEDSDKVTFLSYVTNITKNTLPPQTLSIWQINTEPVCRSK